MDRKTLDKAALIAGPRYDDPPAAREALCLFHVEQNSTMLLAQPQHPFKPRGLLLWDVPDSAKVMAMIGTSPQVVVTYESIPCRWFTHWRSFADIVRAGADGIDAAGWGTWDVVSPGVLIRLMFSEPVPNVQALMWGHAAF